MSHHLCQVSVPSTGNTIFCPLTEFVGAMSRETRAKYERLWMRSDRREGPVHPVIYPHPVTGNTTMMIHLGMITGFVYDYGASTQREATREEFAELRAELEGMFDAFWSSGRAHSHQWEEGDFIISDNLAVTHIAAPESQLPRSQVGLRVLHRTTVDGTHRPSK
eukprot:TRINITY_DN13270_c0_g1_i1.p1 TRINITY_DN13270_c0_g1~~TRINITY_DN13270_c0_g1_i1.p1  ORF type:complete len:186 (-),score=28.18 TRINITY_DN13270_c0_g1_i1:204-695(-)